jgi:hypothetical protein
LTLTGAGVAIVMGGIGALQRAPAALAGRYIVAGYHPAVAAPHDLPVAAPLPPASFGSTSFSREPDQAPGLAGPDTRLRRPGQSSHRIAERNLVAP